MFKANMDLSVLLIFFARPNTFSKVFEAVKKARPSKLFLACDGARDGNTKDVEGIARCKKIVEDIDWECEVYTNYATENLGCGRGPSNAISWAFEYTDSLVILEDDCVPDDTLFPFMKEMLEKYKNDEKNMDKKKTNDVQEAAALCPGQEVGRKLHPIQALQDRHGAYSERH